MEAKEQSQARDKESGGGKDDDLPDVGSLPIMQMAEEYTKYANEHQGEKLEKFTPDWKTPKDNSKPKSPSSAPAAMDANREAGGSGDEPVIVDLPLMQDVKEYTREVDERNARGEKIPRFRDYIDQKYENQKKSSSVPSALKAKKEAGGDEAGGDDGLPDVGELPIIQMANERARLARENPGVDLGEFTPNWKPPRKEDIKPKSPSSTSAALKAKKNVDIDDDNPPDVSSLPIMQMAEEYTKYAEEHKGEKLEGFTPNWRPPKEKPQLKSFGSVAPMKSIGNIPATKSIGNATYNEIGGEPQITPPLAPSHKVDPRLQTTPPPLAPSHKVDPRLQTTPPPLAPSHKPVIDPSTAKVVPQIADDAKKQAEEQKKKQAEETQQQQPTIDQSQTQEQQSQDFNPDKAQEGSRSLNWIESLISQAVQNAFRIGGTIFDLGKRAIDRLGDGPADVQAPWGDKLPYGGRFGFIAIDKECKGNITDVTHEDDGSYSYGLYQFNSGRGGKTGTMQRFMVYLKEKYPALYAPLKDKTVGSNVFNEAYKKVAKENEKQMGDAQEEFLKIAYYQPALNEVGKNSGGSDLIKRFGQNRAFQEMLVSTAIQHGPGGARSIFRDAWNSLSEEQKTADEKTTLTALIKAVYNERGKDSRFPTVLSTKTAAQRANFMKSMQNRYASESQMVLALLSGGRPQGNHGDIGKPNHAFPGYPKISQEVLSGWKIPSSEPLIWPAQSSVITSPMGRRPQPSGGGSTWHEGVDVRAPLDAPIYAAMSGQVVGVGQKLGTVKIRHSNGWETRYLHLNRFNVKQGDSVRAGQLIGGSGNIGSSGRPNAGWYPHLHFEMHKDGKLADPEGVFYQYSKGGGHSAYDKMQYKPGVQQYQKLSSKMGGGDSGVKPSGAFPKLSSSKIPMFPRLSDKLEVGGDGGVGGGSIRNAIGNFFGKSQPKEPTPPSTGIVSKPSTIDFESGGDDSRGTKIRTSVTEYLNEKTAGGSGKNIGESIINELKSVKVLIAALIKTSNRPVVAVAPSAPVNDNPKNRMVDDDGSSDLASNNMFSQISGLLPNLNIATTGLGTTIS